LEEIEKPNSKIEKALLTQYFSDSVIESSFINRCLDFLFIKIVYKIDCVEITNQFVSCRRAAAHSINNRIEASAAAFPGCTNLVVPAFRRRVEMKPEFYIFKSLNTLNKLSL